MSIEMDKKVNYWEFPKVVSDLPQKLLRENNNGQEKGLILRLMFNYLSPQNEYWDGQKSKLLRVPKVVSDLPQKLLR